MINLRSKTRRRLLAYYFANPTARHYLRELAEKLDLDPANLSRELERLERQGLFNSERSGRQRYFRINRGYPLFAEVRGIVSKTVGALPLIADALKGLAGMQQAWLYGSFARDQQDAHSDIDLLVIGNPQQELLAQLMRKLERYLGRDINYTLMAPAEFEARLASHDPFIQHLWGNPRISLMEQRFEPTQAAAG